MARTSNLARVEDQHALEFTRARIYAYLHALQPMDGVTVLDSYQRGRELVAILAESSKADGLPTRRLTLSECADVMAFMHLAEPRNRKTFYVDQPGQPSVECGLHFVLIAVEDALRLAAERRR